MNEIISIIPSAVSSVARGVGETVVSSVPKVVVGSVVRPSAGPVLPKQPGLLANALGEKRPVGGEHMLLKLLAGETPVQNSPIEHQQPQTKEELLGSVVDQFKKEGMSYVTVEKVASAVTQLVQELRNLEQERPEVAEAIGKLVNQEKLIQGITESMQVGGLEKTARENQLLTMQVLRKMLENQELRNIIGQLIPVEQQVEVEKKEEGFWGMLIKYLFSALTSGGETQ